jgi:predicted small secreted protein
MVGFVMRGSKLVSLIALLALAVAGAGCNTVKGAGKDVQKAGKAVERAADKAQD